MDKIPPAKRSLLMSKVRSKNTGPELIVRSLVHKLGYRFRLHRKDLPGVPDLVFPKHRKIILVHGCFWHGHPSCMRSVRPESNKQFWENKLEKNIQRDLKNQASLKALQWDVLVVWECELKNVNILTSQIVQFLNRKI